MEKIILSPEKILFLLKKLQEQGFKLKEEDITKALNSTEEIPPPEIQSEATSFQEAREEWTNSLGWDKEKAAIRKEIEFVLLEEDVDRALLESLSDAYFSDDENGMILIIREMAKRIPEEAWK